MQDAGEMLTARLLLRHARADDLADLHAVFSHPRAMRFWSTPPHTQPAQTRDFLQAMIDLPPEQGEEFVVVSDGRVIGKAGCWRLPEVGFILHPDAWGRGFAQEAMAAVVARMFARPELAALTADVDPRNDASLRVLARLGFHETGRASRTFEIGGVWCDSVYLALARPG